MLSLVADRRYDFDSVGFDRNPDLAGLPKGRVVELRTGKIRDATREDRLTMSLRVTPKKGDCPRFKQFLCTRKPERHISEKLSCGPFENNRNMSSTLILLGL